MGDTPRGGFVREYEQERSVPVRECVVYHSRVSASNSESVTIHRCDRSGSVRIVVSCCVVVESTFICRSVLCLSVKLVPLPRLTMNHPAAGGNATLRNEHRDTGDLNKLPDIVTVLCLSVSGQPRE